MIEIRHLRTLQVLRRSGTLAAAADCLHLTPSALSHQVKELEDFLGFPLFRRRSRPLAFTVMGERLLSLGDQVLPALEEFERTWRFQQQGRAGRLHIALECHSCFDWMLPATEGYRDEWPGVEMDFVGGYAFDALPALHDHELDLVITSDPLEHLDGIFYQPLFQYQSLLVLPRHHELLAKQRIEPADFMAQTLISYPVEERRLDIYREFLLPSGIRPAKVRHAELTPMMVQLVASGRGVAVLPDWVAADYVRRGMIEARPLGQGVFCTLYAAIRREDKERAYLQAFLQGLVQYCLRFKPEARSAS